MVRTGGNAIRLGEKIASSAAFKTLFSDGMALVEETASYLDGEGRDDAKSLQRNAALAYASESMRLTTRLMQIASWLLLQRAVNEGEMTQAEVSSDKRRARIAWQQTPTNDAGTMPLPCQLNALIDASMRLQARIVHLDALISDPMPSGDVGFAPRPVEAQLSRLRDAFC